MRENHKVGTISLQAEKRERVGWASILYVLRKAHSLAGHQNVSQNARDRAGSWVLKQLRHML